MPSVLNETKTQTRRSSKKARFKIGEILFIKEPFANEYGDSGNRHYKYDGKKKFEDFKHDENIKWEDMKWSNKLFMGEQDARYFIKITNVRQEHLQDISDADCIAEGVSKMACNPPVYELPPSGNLDDPEKEQKRIDKNKEWEGDYYAYNTPQEAYAVMLDKVNNKKGSWEQNPLLWVYDFQLLQKI